MKIPAAVCLLLLQALTIFAQQGMVSTQVPDDLTTISREYPAWLLRNWGRSAREDRRISDAFLLLNRSLEKDPNNPETLTELALTYFASNDVQQATFNLEQALENRVRLSSKDLEYSILYELADIYRNGNEYVRDYERILLDIVAQDPAFAGSDEFSTNLKESIIDTLNEGTHRGYDSSLDHVVTLYRLEDSFSLKAHVELGVFYVHSGRYRDAQEHLIFAVLKMYSRLISQIRENDPLYAFEDSAGFFQRVSRRPSYLTYLQESRFAQALYYLGSASYGSNTARSGVYRGIWNTVSLLPFDTPFKARAQRQLTSPILEDILYGSRQYQNEVNSRN